jgi:hypothetical protein
MQWIFMFGSQCIMIAYETYRDILIPDLAILPHRGEIRQDKAIPELRSNGLYTCFCGMETASLSMRRLNTGTQWLFILTVVHLEQNYLINAFLLMPLTSLDSV